jgi:hypothetical protein
MIEKIGNVTVEKTDEQERQAWAEVLSHRNKLLFNSDWTQLPDCGLTETSIAQWRSWREQLKNINQTNYSDRRIAEEYIGKMSQRIPFSEYITPKSEPSAEKCISLEEYRNRVMNYLDDTFNEKSKVSFLDNPSLVDEQYKEAIDFLSITEDTLYPLIDTTAEIYGMSRRTVAEEFISRKAECTKRFANLKKKYYYFQTLVIQATSDVELTAIQAEIKQWTSTST